jgi:hypothetical protein
MLHRGELVPHFDVTTLGGETVSYASIWQRRNLVLVTLATSDPEASRHYVSRLTARIPDFTEHATACVITRERVPGIPRSGVLVADRWGEIVHVAAVSDVGDLPAPEELLEWIEYVQSQCPECQGETK